MSSDPADLLRQHSLRVTPQRRAILQAFQGASDEHLSAEEVMARASTAVPEIGRGTVYATLAELTDVGLLMSVGQSEPIRYEINTGPHDHFRCRLCLRLFDIEFGGRDLAQRSLPGYTVESVAVRAEGICNDCSRYTEGLNEGIAMIHATRLLDDEQIAQLACQRHPTILGDLGLAASAAGVVRIAFQEHPDHDAIIRRGRTRRGSAAAREHLRRLTDALDHYLAGTHRRIADAPTDVALPTTGALRATRTIPFGQRRSYHLLGIAAPAYDAGYTLGSNPLPLIYPCHRVTCGRIRPDAYVGGPARLHVLQQLEEDTSTA